MNLIVVGKIINTFGIKGELKILSNFEYKDNIFKEGMKLYIGEEKCEEIISTHRVHKNYDLLTLKSYDNINEVLKYKNKTIYFNRNDLKLGENEYLLSDLIGFLVYDNDVLLGKIIDYENNNNYVLFKVAGENKFYLPNNSHYIKDIIIEEKKIITNNGSDLII